MSIVTTASCPVSGMVRGWGRAAASIPGRVAGALLIFALGSPASLAQETRPPNMVIILADDLGYGDLGCYNPESKIPTPWLDRLAREGMQLTDAHSPSSVCTPTRYGLLTGRYCWRTRLQAGVILTFQRPLIAADRLTLPGLLKQRGYVTACIGKWHLGWVWPTKDGALPSLGEDKLSNVDYSQPIGEGPCTRGFDYYFGDDIPNFPPYVFIENDRTLGIPSVLSRPEYNRPGPMLPGWDWTNVMPEITRRSAEFITSHVAANPEQPFFLYFPLTAPHYPVVPTEEFRGRSAAGEYGDFVAQVDDAVGRVLQALDDAGVAENTLLIFTSDNGPEVTGEVDPGVYDRIARYGHYSLDGLRGAKRDLWEGGHRVPCLARWPGRIPAGSQSGALVCQTDFLATCAALVGAELPADAAEDSFNILPILTGKEPEAAIREAVVHHSGSGRFAIRRGDWVLIVAQSGDDNRQAGEPDWFRTERGYTQHDRPGELYNLAQDPTQARNLYAHESDKVRELSALLEEYVANGRSTPGPAQQNDVPVVVEK